MLHSNLLQSGKSILKSFANTNVVGSLALGTKARSNALSNAFKPILKAQTAIKLSYGSVYATVLVQGYKSYPDVCVPLSADALLWTSISEAMGTTKGPLASLALPRVTPIPLWQKESSHLSVSNGSAGLVKNTAANGQKIKAKYSTASLMAKMEREIAKSYNEDVIVVNRAAMDIVAAQKALEPVPAAAADKNKKKENASLMVGKKSAAPKKKSKINKKVASVPQLTAAATAPPVAEPAPAPTPIPEPTTAPPSQSTLQVMEDAPAPPAVTENSAPVAIVPVNNKPLAARPAADKENVDNTSAAVQPADATHVASGSHSSAAATRAASPKKKARAVPSVPLAASRYSISVPQMPRVPPLPALPAAVPAVPAPAAPPATEHQEIPDELSRQDAINISTNSAPAAENIAFKSKLNPKAATFVPKGNFEEQLEAAKQRYAAQQAANTARAAASTSKLNPYAKPFVPQGNYPQLLAAAKARVVEKSTLNPKAAVFAPNPDCPYTPEEIVKAFKELYGQ